MNPRIPVPGVVLALLTACGGAPPPEPAPAPEAAEEAGGRLELSPLVRRNLGITFAEVEVRDVERTIRVPGAFELRPLARREYRMSLPGRVELLVDQYDVVDVGQPLYRFQSPAWPELLHEIVDGEQAIESALGEIAVSEARLEEARANLAITSERIESLARADLRKAELEARAAELQASLPRIEAELQLARTVLENARRKREHALHRAALAAWIPEEELVREVEHGGERVPAYRTIEWILARASQPGIVEQLAVTHGAFVEPPALVLSTVDPEQVRFRANALQADLPRLMQAEETRIVPPRSEGVPISTGIPATLTLSLEAHPRERTLTVLATPEGPAPWIRPGVSAFLEIVVASSDGPALAVPRSAIVQDGLEHVLFRRDPRDPEAVIRVQADMGPSDGRWVVLKSGVARGDQVVLDGAYELKLAMQSAGGVPAGGHVHADGTTHADH